MARKTYPNYFTRLVLFSFLLTACHLLPVSVNASRNTQSLSGQPDTSWMNLTLSKIRNFEIVNSDSVFFLLDSIIAIAEKAGNEKALGSAYYQCGIYHYRNNQYQRAKESFDHAITIAQEIKDTLTWAKSLQESGSLALTMGDDHLCLKLNFEALPLFETIGYQDGIARVYNIIGLYKCGQKEYDSAISYYNKAMVININTGNQKGIVHNKGNLAYLYELTGHLEQSEKIYLELETQLIETGDSLLLPVIYADLSSVCRKKGDLNEALDYSKKAVRICELTKDTAALAGNSGDLGELYLLTKQPDSARFYLTQAIRCSRVINDPEIEILALKFLIKIDSLNGNHKDAIQKYRQVLVLKDTVFNRKYKNHLKASELIYENQKKSMLIETQKYQIEAGHKQKRLYISLLIFTILVLILSTLVIFYYLKYFRKKQNIYKNQLLIKDLQIENATKNELIQQLKIEKFEESLKIKEMEQVSQALALEQKNELLNLISSKIVSSMKDTGLLNITELNSIVSSIRMQINDKNESDLFNQKFNQVHTNFYNNLTKVHPELTKSELKFCAYLKLNLTSHQIANIMNVTNEAIRKNRYRIRKKMGLTQGNSLENYLSSF
jgi:tetratricopeptide (TPR) repeat protein